FTAFQVQFGVVAIRTAHNHPFRANQHYAIAAVGVAQRVVCRDQVRVERPDAAVVPIQLHFRFIMARFGELKLDDRRWWTTFRNILWCPIFNEYLANACFDLGGVSQPECSECGIDQMTPHVAQGAGTGIPPAMPLKRMPGRTVIHPFRRANPQIPIQIVWYRVLLRMERDALRPYGPACPNVGFMY